MASIEKISKGQLDYSTTMQRLWRHVATLQSSCRSKEDRTNCCIRARRPVHPRSIHFREIWPNISEWGQEVVWWVHKRAFYTFGGAIKQRGWRRWRQLRDEEGCKCRLPAASSKLVENLIPHPNATILQIMRRRSNGFRVLVFAGYYLGTKSFGSKHQLKIWIYRVDFNTYQLREALT